MRAPYVNANGERCRDINYLIYTGRDDLPVERYKISAGGTRVFIVYYCESGGGIQTAAMRKESITIEQLMLRKN